MIIDVRHVPNGSVLEADICIIGCGAAAIAMAMELAGKPLDVCILESGGLSFDRDAHALAGGTQSGIPYFELTETSYRLLGGSTFRWGARASPLKPIDFAEREWVPHSGWPLSREHLDPYYERAAALIGLHRPFNYEGRVWDGFGVSPPAFDPDVFTPCAFQFGKNVLLGEVYRTQLKQARNIRIYLHASAQEIRSDRQARHVDGVEVAVLTGQRYVARARNYVLACGGIENPRLLLLSNSANPGGLCNDDDLVGRYFMEHPTVSAGTIESPRWHVLHDLFSPGLVTGRLVEVGLALAPAVQKAERCLNAIARTSLVVTQDSTQALRELLSNLRYRRMPHQLGWYYRNRWLAQRLGAIARDPLGIVSNIARHAMGKPKRFKADSVRLEIRAEQEPNPDSRVTLSDELDAFGRRRAHLHWCLTKRDKCTIQVAASAFANELGRLGLGTLNVAEWLRSDELTWPGEMVGGHHHMGTTRMSRDPSTGIVDSDCKAHALDNLYIAGSSVFPTGGYVNPTFTVLALAHRLAEHLEARVR
jgi:choline dehydrogenase-like flavoprotein